MGSTTDLETANNSGANNSSSMHVVSTINLPAINVIPEQLQLEAISMVATGMIRVLWHALLKRLRDKIKIYSLNSYPRKTLYKMLMSASMKGLSIRKL
jgi:hypothetical protein